MSGADVVDLQRIERDLRSIDWDDLDDIHVHAGGVLEEAARPDVLRALCERVLADEAILERCERFDLFTKVVLHEEPASGARLRLHVFGAEEVEEAHNHRATFCARLLHGRYRHYIYGTEEYLDRTDAGRPAPLWRQDQTAGNSYTLHHELVHSTLAGPETVSLIVQGPRVRPRFRILDLVTGAERVRVGAAEATGAQEPGEQRLGRTGLEQVLDRLRELRLVA